MNLSLPEGYVMPESARPGESFEAVATLKPNDDGSFELVALDGMPLGGGNDTEEVLDGAQKLAKKVRLPWDQPDSP